jgi:hypothetical protein
VVTVSKSQNQWSDPARKEIPYSIVSAQYIYGGESLP